MAEAEGKKEEEGPTQNPPKDEGPSRYFHPHHPNRDRAPPTRTFNNRHRKDWGSSNDRAQDYYSKQEGPRRPPQPRYNNNKSNNSNSNNGGYRGGRRNYNGNGQGQRFERSSTFIPFGDSKSNSINSALAEYPEEYELKRFQDQVHQYYSQHQRHFFRQHLQFQPSRAPNKPFPPWGGNSRLGQPPPNMARPPFLRDYLPLMPLGLRNPYEGRAPFFGESAEGEWAWHEKTFGAGGQGDSKEEEGQGHGLFDKDMVVPYISPQLHDLLFTCLKPLMTMTKANAMQLLAKRPALARRQHMGVDDFDSLSVTDSGVFSDNDGCSSGRSSPVSCKAGELGERDRFAILTYDQVKRVDSVLNEVVALEGRGNFPALEVKLKDLLTAVKDRLVQEGIKIRDIRLNGGAASYALKDRLDFCCVCGVVYTPSGDDGGMLCSCISSEGQTKNFSYNDIDLIFGMELTTAKHFDRVKTAVLDALLDLLPPQVSRKRMSPCALKEAYVSKMVKVCEGDRWSLIALGNGPAANSSSKGRSCSVELKFVDTMRRQYEFSVDSFQIVLDSLMLFYKCATVPMSSRFYPTVVGESVFGDFYGALYHLQNGLIATRHPEEIRGGGLLKYCNLLVRGYRPADIHSIPPLQRYMCSRFFIDFPEVEQQESKLRTYLANHMSGVSARLRYAFLITLYHVVDSSTVCLMGHERRLTLNLIQRLACELFSTDCGQGIYGPQPNQMYHCYSTYYSPQLTNGSNGSTASSLTESNHPAPSANGTTYYPTPQISAAASASAPAVVSGAQPHNYQSHPRPTSNNNKTLRHSQPQPTPTASKTSSTPAVTTVPLLTASS